MASCKNAFSFTDEWATARGYSDKWAWLAACAAMDAYENNFPSRRGFYPVEDAACIVYYDSNPFAAGPHLRELLISQFREFMRSNGIAEKASAYWPTSGEGKDYTFAMVMGADETKLAEIKRAFEKITLAFVGLIGRPGDLAEFLDGHKDGLEDGHDGYRRAMPNCPAYVLAYEAGYSDARAAA